LVRLIIVFALLLCHLHVPPPELNSTPQPLTAAYFVHILFLLS
jgi:hypothetical protein